MNRDKPWVMRTYSGHSSARASNELYRNHLSLIKDFVPEVGRNFKVIYGVKF